MIVSNNKTKGRPFAEQGRLACGARSPMQAPEIRLSGKAVLPSVFNPLSLDC